MWIKMLRGETVRESVRSPCARRVASKRRLPRRRGESAQSVQDSGCSPHIPPWGSRAPSLLPTLQPRAMVSFLVTPAFASPLACPGRPRDVGLPLSPFLARPRTSARTEVSITPRDLMTRGRYRRKGREGQCFEAEVPLRSFRHAPGPPKARKPRPRSTLLARSSKVKRHSRPWNSFRSFVSQAKSGKFAIRELVALGPV